MTEEKQTGTPEQLVPTLSVKQMVEQARGEALKNRKPVVTNRKDFGKAYIRNITIKKNGKVYHYQQVRRHYYDQDGKRREQVIQHISRPKEKV